MKRFLIVCIAVVLMTVTSTAAELQLVGKAERDAFVRIKSDEPGRWIVLGPGVIAVREVAPGIGLPILNRREVIVLEENKECVFVGPPGTYAVILSPEGQGDFSFLPVFIEGQTPPPTPDKTPPVLTGMNPSGELPKETSRVTLSVTSDEQATVKYSVEAGTPFAEMSEGLTSIGANQHVREIPVQAGRSYKFYARAQDIAGNVSTADSVISFTIGKKDVEVPADRFDNVGRLSFQLSNDNLVQKLSDSGERDQITDTATAYKTISADFLNPTKPPNSLAQFQTVVKGKQLQIWGSQATVWSSFATEINKQYVKHIKPGESTRQDVADFWTAVAVGLEYSVR